MRFIVVLTMSVLSINLSAQVVPPALGDIPASSWMAFGIKQKLNPDKKLGWLSDTYFGTGRISNKGDFNPFQKHGIFILNQEFYHQFHKDWEYSLALSYRNQRRYEKEAPYELADPKYRQEFRFYTRFSYKFKYRQFEWTPTVRNELMKYTNPDWSNFAENIRYRLRLRMKFSYALDAAKQHKLSLYSEQLFYTSWMNDGSRRKFNYSDSRFSFFYSYTFKDVPLTLDIGYMNNLMGIQKAKSGHYFAFDIIWKDPFRKKSESN